MKYIRLLIGDVSGDGHEKMATEVIKSEHEDFSVKTVEKAYKAGVKKTGFDLVKHCADYEDHTIPATEIHKLYPDITEDMEVWCSDEWASMYVDLVNIGNPYLQVELIKYDEIPSIDIRGYGIFV